jgi:hypothetical protein
MIRNWEDLLAVFAVMTCMMIMVSSAFAVLLYVHFQERLEKLEKKVRRTILAKKQPKTSIHNPPAEAIAPPPMAEPYFPPDPEPTPEPEVSHLQVYLKANEELWKLRVKGDDDSGYAEYLRSVMEETYANLDATERESAERDSAEAWKQV